MKKERVGRVGGFKVNIKRHVVVNLSDSKVSAFQCRFPGIKFIKKKHFDNTKQAYCVGTFNREGKE